MLSADLCSNVSDIEVDIQVAFGLNIVSSCLQRSCQDCLGSVKGQRNISEKVSGFFFVYLELQKQMCIYNLPTCQLNGCQINRT